MASVYADGTSYQEGGASAMPVPSFAPMPGTINDQRAAVVPKP